MVQFITNKEFKGQLISFSTIIHQYKLRQSCKIILCAVSAITCILIYVRFIKTADDHFILKECKDAINIYSPKHTIVIRSIKEITITKLVKIINVMPLKAIYITSSTDNVIISSPIHDIYVQVPEGFITEESVEQVNASLSNDLIIKPVKDIIVVKAYSDVTIGSLKNSIFVSPDEKVILHDDFIFHPQSDVVIKSLSKNSELKLEVPKNSHVLKLYDNIVIKPVKDTNGLLKRSDFVEAEIVNKNVSEFHKNFQVFMKWLSLQKFMNEEFSVEKFKRFVELYCEITGVTGVEQTIKLNVNNLPTCILSRNISNVPVKINRIVNNPDFEYPMVQKGGFYKPSECNSGHKVAILVPIQKVIHEENLRVFLQNIHPFLMRQKLEYRIFVLEQYGKQDPLNKGRLYNAAFHEIQKMGDFQCLVFHDVELLPTDYRIRYTCPTVPRHMSAVIIQEGNNSKFFPEFGGVTAMVIWHYRILNGYSNMYWGWSEDADMFIRLKSSGFRVTRYKKDIAQYITLSHSYPKHAPKKEERMDRLLDSASERSHVDGLSNIKYKHINTTFHRLYTRIVLDVNPDREIISLY